MQPSNPLIISSGVASLSRKFLPCAPTRRAERGDGSLVRVWSGACVLHLRLAHLRQRELARSRLFPRAQTCGAKDFVVVNFLLRVLGRYVTAGRPLRRWLATTRRLGRRGPRVAPVPSIWSGALLAVWRARVPRGRAPGSVDRYKTSPDRFWASSGGRCTDLGAVVCPSDRPS